jgi:hypothetical protein
MRNYSNKLTPEQMERLRLAVEDRWSFSEIQRTLGHNKETVRRHFPEYNGWTVLEGAKMGAFITHNLKMRDVRDNMYT